MRNLILRGSYDTMTTRRHRIGSASEDAFGYSRAVMANGFVFVSGTSGWDPATGAIDPDPLVQLDAAFGRLEASLAPFGAGLGDIVQLQVFCRTMELWQRLGPAAAGHIRKSGCALFVAAAELPSPEFAVELVCIATAPRGGTSP